MVGTFQDWILEDNALFSISDILILQMMISVADNLVHMPDILSRPIFTLNKIKYSDLASHRARLFCYAKTVWCRINRPLNNFLHVFIVFLCSSFDSLIDSIGITFHLRRDSLRIWCRIFWSLNFMMKFLTVDENWGQENWSRLNLTFIFPSRNLTKHALKLWATSAIIFGHL